MTDDLTPEQIAAADAAARLVPHRVVNGLAIPLTAEEIAEIAADKAADAARVFVPQSVTRTQALLALLDAGITEAAIASQIALIPDELARERARIRFNGQVWQRGSDLIVVMAAAFGLTPEQVDDLFIAAGRL